MEDCFSFPCNVPSTVSSSIDSREPVSVTEQAVSVQGQASSSPSGHVNRTLGEEQSQPLCEFLLSRSYTESQR